MSFQFSYIQQEYHGLNEHSRRLGWKNKEVPHYYEKCTVQVIGLYDKARIIIRRELHGKSTFAKSIRGESDFTIKLMMGFITTKAVLDSENQILFEIEQSNDLEHRDLKEVRISSDNKEDITLLLLEINQTMKKPTRAANIIDPEYYEKYLKMMPVVYQPNIDAWKNILREIQVHKAGDCHEVTLVFEDENLREHGIFDFIYRIYRFFKYRRTVDIETFQIQDRQFNFKKIYSGDHTLFKDSIHETKKVAIKYYFQDENHPVVFVNTSNHALAEKDNNHDFWKREYVPWSKKTPIKHGEKTRKDIENFYKRF